MTRGVEVDFTMTLVTEECCNCGVSFAFPAALKSELLKERSRLFYCPNGHSQHYLGETEETKLRRERDRLKQQLAQKDDEILVAVRLQEAAERNAAKLKKRVAHGVCPCCTRSFQNLKRHISTKAPRL